MLLIATRISVHSYMRGSAYDSFPPHHYRFTSELFTKNDDMGNPLLYVLRSDYPKIAQKYNHNETKQCHYLLHSRKNYIKFADKKNRLQVIFTRIMPIAEENKKAAGE